MALAPLLVMSAAEAAKRGITPMAKIVSWATAGVDPSIMGTGPIPASRKALERAGIEPGRVIAYKPLLDHALELASHQPDATVILQRPQLAAAMGERDHDWAELAAAAQEARAAAPASTGANRDPRSRSHVRFTEADALVRQLLAPATV